jgi:hypothetical protein
MAMALESPGGLSLTGDIYGGPGQNFFTRTANVKAHGLFLGGKVVP